MSNNIPRLIGRSAVGGGGGGGDVTGPAGAVPGNVAIFGDASGKVIADAGQAPGIPALVNDLSPQLGANLDVNGFNINQSVATRLDIINNAVQDGIQLFAQGTYVNIGNPGGLGQVVDLQAGGCAVVVGGPTGGVSVTAPANQDINLNTSGTGRALYNGVEISTGGGGGGSTDLSASWKDAQSVNVGTIDVGDYQPGFATNQMGWRMPWNGTLEDISFTTGSSSTGSAGTFTIALYKVTGTLGVQRTAGTGTLLGSVSLISGGAEAVAYYRGAETMGLGASVLAGDTIFCDCSVKTGWNITDLVVNARFQKS